MIKRVYAILMTYDVTSDEKRFAEQALDHFNEASKLLSLASDHINIIKTPFKDNPPSKVEEILENRVALRRFRDKSAENFNGFKIKAFACVNSMKTFQSDTMTSKLMKSFINAIESLETDVNQFLEFFEDLKSADFQKNVVKESESIQSKCDDIIDIIEQRIRDHIQNNILAKNWVDGISDELQTNVEKHVPILTQIHQEEKKEFNKIINNR